MNEINVTVTKRPDRKYFTMRYTDPLTGAVVARSSKKTVRRDAEREAGKWEAELREGRYQAPVKTTWKEFRERYEEEHLLALSPRTFSAACSALNHVETHLNPKYLASVDASAISRLQSKMRGEKSKKTGKYMSASTLHTHLRHFRAALGWAVEVGMLAKVPKFKMPKRARSEKAMRGRPITAEELERMITAVVKVRPDDAADWQRYLEGLWLCGLRLGESLELSWDSDSANLWVDLTGKRPKLRILAEGEKGNRDRTIPLTPDFAAFLLRTPADERKGRVFKLRARRGGALLRDDAVSRVVCRIGEKAKVIVNSADQKFASAHDLRRAFGTRWAARVKPATLQKMMRHASIETTLKFYVDFDADELGDELWRYADQLEVSATSSATGQNDTAQAAESDSEEETQDAIRD